MKLFRDLFPGTLITLALIFPTLNGLAGDITLEAENGVLTGTHFSHDGSGYFGNGYVTGFVSDSNRIAWAFPADEGDYDLQIVFRSPFGHKDFRALLNGLAWTGSFPQDANFARYDAGRMHLIGGTNRLEIGGGMNWYDINRALFIPAGAASPARSGVPGPLTRTVQINVKELLNARPITTFGRGKLTSWTEGLDGDWSGEATFAAAQAMGTATTNALPDNGSFPADARHPEINLNYSNTDEHNPQVRRSEGTDSYGFAVQEEEYAKMILVFMSANGSSRLNVSLAYQGGLSEGKNIEVPDWYNPIPASDRSRFNLASDLAKWTKSNEMSEPNHHYLYGVELDPMPGKKLERVTISKSPDGTLTFWGATGVVGAK